MVIPTDKMNLYKVINKEKYIEWVLDHLKTDAIEVSADKLIKIHEEGNELLLKFGNTLSEKEMGFVEEMLDSRAVPTPKLLIKDHKPMNEKGEYVTRLIVPATNFAAAFPKVGYLGIKNIFDQNGIDYSGSTITQASQLKMTLEKLNIMKDKVTIISFDAVRMYPSIKYKFVRKAVKFFARNLNAETQRQIDTCLEMIKFSMGNTLLTFVDKYYKYGGDLNVEDRGLTIGGYESAWLADLCMAYVTDNSRDILDELVYEGIYRDNGIAIFKGLVTTSKVAKWLGILQARVNNLADSKFLEFTMEVWGNDRDDGRKYKAVGTTNKDYFLFLDMEMYWSPEGNLQFRVHLKENQVLKYLNHGSTHTDACFAAIPTGVMKRLASCTTRTEKSELTTMDKLYPAHAKALKKANLAPDIFPTLGEILDNQQMDPTVNNAKERKDMRTVQFCLGMSKWWNDPVHTILKEL
jgi:hypothetical protein